MSTAVGEYLEYYLIAHGLRGYDDIKCPGLHRLAMTYKKEHTDDHN